MVRPHGRRAVAAIGQGYFPVAALLLDGEVIAAIRGGAPHMGPRGRLDLVRSCDGGVTWSPPATIVDSDADDRNPALGVAGDGTLVLAYAALTGYRGEQLDRGQARFEVSLVRSGDGGRSWTAPEPLDASPWGWASPYGRIARLADGTLLLAVYGGPGAPYRTDPESLARRTCSAVWRSRDDGATWGDRSIIAEGFNETALLPLGGDALLAALRGEGGGVHLSRSEDGGRSWSAPRQITRACQHPGDLVQLPDGRVLLTYGHREAPYGARAVIGEDGGTSWPGDREIVLWDDAANADCGYPSGVVLPGGEVLIVCYMAGSRDHPEWGPCAPVLICSPDELTPN